MSLLFTNKEEHNRKMPGKSGMNLSESNMKYSKYFQAYCIKKRNDMFGLNGIENVIQMNLLGKWRRIEIE